MKVADVTLSWNCPPDAVGVQVFVVNNGVTQEYAYGPDVMQMQITMEASTSCQFRVVTFDAEGNFDQGGVYSFTLNDLNRPQPATDLRHEVGDVREESGR